MKICYFFAASALMLAACATNKPAEGTADETTDTKHVTAEQKTESQTAEDPVEALVEMFEVMNTERRAAPEYFADDAKFSFIASALAPEPFGLERANQMNEQTLAMSSDLEAKPLRIIDIGGNVYIVQVYLTGTFDQPVGEMKPTNEKIGMGMVQIYTFGDDGKIKHVEMLRDEMTMMVQTGRMKNPLGATAPIREMPTTEPVVLQADESQNQQLVEQYGKHRELFRARPRNEEAILAVFAEGVEIGMPPRPGFGATELVEQGRMFAQALTEGSSEVEGMWTAGDLLVVRAVGKAKHSGTIGPFEATDKWAMNPYFDFIQFKDGKVVAMSGYNNPLYTMKSLGLFPPPQQKSGDASGEASSAK